MSEHKRWSGWRLRLLQRAVRWCARRMPYQLVERREWLILRDSMGDSYIRGEIPRDVAEAFGLDMDGFDDGRGVWVPYEISLEIHNHPEFYEYDVIEERLGRRQ